VSGKSNTGLIIAIVVGVLGLGVLGLVVVVGGAAFLVLARKPATTTAPIATIAPVATSVAPIPDPVPIDSAPIATTTTTPTATTAKPIAVAPHPTAAPKKPDDLETLLNAGKPSATSDTSAFDRGAAASALTGVNVQSCAKPDGPTGSGRVKITFAPSGMVTSATTDPPYEGTAVGGCIAGKYRSIHVPPFSGAPVTVSKSFSIPSQ